MIWLVLILGIMMGASIVLVLAALAQNLIGDDPFVSPPQSGYCGTGKSGNGLSTPPNMSTAGRK